MEPSNYTTRRSGVCERCKKLKTRCDRKDDAPCTSCEKQNLRCIPAIARARGKAKPMSQYIKTMEERIAQMEKALKCLPLGQEMPFTGGRCNTLIEEQARLSHKMSTHILKCDGETDYIGSSSALSIISPESLQWLPGLIGSYSMERIMILLNRFRSSSDSSFSDLTQTEKNQSQNLPPKDIAAPYIFNRALPLFDKATFLQYFERQYSNNAPTSASCFPESTEHTRTSGYFHNAMSVLPDLIFRNPDTMSIQAIIAMMIIADSKLLFQVSSMLLSMAIRLALDKGFHRRLTGNNVSDSVKRSRANIFWILYVLDKGTCIRFGHPSLIDDDEISIDPPSPAAARPHGQNLSFFRAFIDLALIQNKVCKWLYSARFQTRPAKQRLFLFGELEGYLDAWKASLHPEFQPEAQVGINKASHHFDIHSVLMLQMTYYYTVATVHRVSLFLDLDPELEEELKQHSSGGVVQAELSALVCLSASRTTIHLLRYGNCSFDILPLPSWCTIYYVLVAALVIFSHVVRDPTDPEAETDVSYLRLFATTLRKSSIGTGSPHIEALQALAELILSIAEPIVHHHQQGQLQQRLKPPSIVLPEPSSRHVPYTPGQHEQPLSVSMIPTMCAGPSSAIPQNHDHSLSSAVNAAGSIFDFLFQPSENPSRSPLSTPADTSSYAFSTPLDMSRNVENREGLGFDEIDQQAHWDSYHWYT